MWANRDEDILAAQRARRMTANFLVERTGVGPEFTHFTEDDDAP